MVKSAEADIVCPSVTTEDPLGFLGQIFFLFEDTLNIFALAADSFKNSNKFLSCRTICSAVCECLDPFFCCCCNFLGLCVFSDVLYFFFQSAADRIVCKHHTISKISCIFKQGV